MGVDTTAPPAYTDFMTTTPKMASIEVTSHAATEYRGDHVELTLLLPSGRKVVGAISVYGPEEWMGGSIRPARVNWSALGAGPVEDAVAFAEALKYAAEMAEGLRGPLERQP